MARVIFYYLICLSTTTTWSPANEGMEPSAQWSAPSWFWMPTTSRDENHACDGETPGRTFEVHKRRDRLQAMTGNHMAEDASTSVHQPLIKLQIKCEGELVFKINKYISCLISQHDLGHGNNLANAITTENAGRDNKGDGECSLSLITKL